MHKGAEEKETLKTSFHLFTDCKEQRKKKKNTAWEHLRYLKITGHCADPQSLKVYKA